MRQNERWLDLLSQLCPCFKSYLCQISLAKVYLLGELLNILSLIFSDNTFMPFHSDVILAFEKYLATRFA